MEQKVKCDRCGRIRDLFQYTVFKPGKKAAVQKVQDNGAGANPRYTSYFEETVIEPNESRGLCEECAVELNKRWYDEQEPKIALDRAMNEVIANQALSSKAPVFDPTRRPEHYQGNVEK